MTTAIRVGSPKVAIVNETFAKKFFSGVNPLGRVFRVAGPAGKPDPTYQIVGVVRNTKYYELREDFLPIGVSALGSGRESRRRSDLRSAHGGAAWRPVPRRQDHGGRSHPGIVIEFHVMTAQLQESLMRDRLMATLAGAFGFLAAVLATLGLYGVIAYMVARRRNEIGVRMALGADRGRVVRLVLREAALLLAVGTGDRDWPGALGRARRQRHAVRTEGDRSDDLRRRHRAAGGWWR